MKKIMFNDKYGLTKAVLEGRKTMTRRLFRCLPIDYDRRNYGSLSEGYNLMGDKSVIFRCGQNLYRSLYKVGEIVALAQSYEDAGYYPMGRKDEPGWRNKMFVRAELMPHQIRITNVRVERLQDISDEDCLREGIVKVQWMYGCEGLCERGDQLYFGRPRMAFASLIDRISGKGTFEGNPWVFVYEFELVK